MFAGLLIVDVMNALLLLTISIVDVDEIADAAKTTDKTGTTAVATTEVSV